MSSERLRRLDDDALAAAVRVSGDGLRWPATPDIASAVRREIVSVRPRAGIGVVWPALPRHRRLVLLVAAVLVLLGGAALAAKLVIDVGAVTIRTIPGRPTAPPTDTVGGAEIGKPVTLEEGERLTGITARYPAELGAPDDVWTDRGVVGFDPLEDTPWIAMAWDAGADLPPIGDTDRGAVLIQFHGQADVAGKVPVRGDGIDPGRRPRRDRGLLDRWHPRVPPACRRRAPDVPRGRERAAVAGRRRHVPARGRPAARGGGSYCDEHPSLNGGTSPGRAVYPRHRREEVR